MNRVRSEILIVLAVTFGMSGLRSLLRLVDGLLNPAPLSEQSVTLNASQSDLAWLDIALQLCSAGALFAWGALALFLLQRSLPRPQLSDAASSPALALLIGVPGLALYITALHFGWTKEVVPTDFNNPWVEVPTLLVWSAANAFAEETVVVFWFISRLRQLRISPWAAIAASAVLRGSYHLYQGVSAGFGNLAMGLIFGYYFHKTGKVWPLIIAHFLIDAVAFVGYAFLPSLDFLRI